MKDKSNDKSQYLVSDSPSSNTNNFFSNTLIPKTIPNNNKHKGYSLNLTSIMKQKTDEKFHSHVMAYFDDNFTVLSAKKRNEDRSSLTFNEYFMYLSDSINDLQRDKFKCMEELINFLSPYYNQKSHTAHKQFCKELLDIIALCMCTSVSSWTNTTRNSSLFKIPEQQNTREFIEQFWEHALFSSISAMENSTKYRILISKLMILIGNGFEMQHKLDEIKDHYMSISANLSLNPCVSWEYLNTLSTNWHINKKIVTQFKLDYELRFSGLKANYVYLPAVKDILQSRIDASSTSKLDKTQYKKFMKMFQHYFIHDFQEKSDSKNNCLKF